MNKEKNIEIVDVSIKDLLPAAHLVQELANGKTQHLLKLVKAGILQMATPEESEEMKSKVEAEELDNLKNSQTSIFESKLNKLEEKYSIDGYDP